MIIFKSGWSGFGLFLIITFTISCVEEETIPETGTISGEVTFQGDWPDTGSVSLSLSTYWPLTGVPYDFIEIVEGDFQGNTYEYSFEEVAFDTFVAVMASWEHPANSSGGSMYVIPSVLGYHLDTLVVSDDLNDISDVDLDVDLDLIPSLSESGILGGKVTFNGTWPDIGDIYIALMEYWLSDPEFSGIPSYIISIVNDDVTVLSDSTSEYSYQYTFIELNTYQAIVVSWMDPEDSNPITNQQILGVYGGTSEEGFMDAESVELSSENLVLTDRDITANLGLATSGR